MADFTYRVPAFPFEQLVVMFYFRQPYRDEAFLRARVAELRGATPLKSGLSVKAIFQGPIHANQFLPQPIARLHARCPHCTGLRIEPAVFSSGGQRPA